MDRAVESGGDATLALTGERTVPGVWFENYWFRRHEAAYEFAVTHARGTLLEVGCGEGYGTARLARSPRVATVTGIDYDAATLAHAARTYPAASFARGNLAALPVRSAAVDVLSTLQVIEHVWNLPEFLGECRRVLRPGGSLLVTTPNRLTFSPGLDAPVNPFHVKEFNAPELAGLLSRCGFDVEQVLGLHAGARLRELDRRHGGSFVAAQLGSAPEAWTERLRTDVRSVTTGDFPVDDHVDVDVSLDLVVLARRPA